MGSTGIGTSVSRDQRLAAAKQEANYDTGLIKRFLAGDESAFVQIVQRHQSRVFQTALRFLRSKDDAEEITQDTFIRAYRCLVNFRGDSSLASWLYCITTNLARNRYWYLVRRKQNLKLSLDMPIGEDGEGNVADLLAAEGQNPSQQTAMEEFSEIVSRCMKMLSRTHREILAMRIEDHCSYEEISEAFCIDVGTVKSRIARARGELLRHIAQACPEFTEGDQLIQLLIGDNRGKSTIRVA